MDKDLLLARRVPEGDVELEGLGTVKVRGMSRYELLHSSRVRDEKGDLAAERYILSVCMVDPALAEHEVAEWQKASLAPEINAVAMKVNELSGVAQGADKSGVQETGDES